MYTVTLEERATCPKTCKHWYDCYGNTAHSPKESVGGRIAIMNEQRWDRWSIRFSNYPRYKLSANSDVVSKNGITCPEQAGQTKSCGTCGLCWNKSTKRILFMTHSRDLRKGKNDKTSNQLSQ